MKKQITKYKAASNQEDEFEPDQFLGYHERVQPLSHISIAIDEDIREPKYYRHVLARISDLEEGDCVELTISSHGGSVDGAISIINALNRTDAHTVAFIDGIAASAASLIAFSCQEVIVSENAQAMLHSAHGVIGGTMANTASYSAFMDAELRKLMTKVYLGYLTEEELEQMFMGREVWHNAEQIVERLERKKQYLEDLQSKQKKPERKHPNLPRDWDDN